MRIRFPGESADYRAARDRLLQQEIKAAVVNTRKGVGAGNTGPRGMSGGCTGSDPALHGLRAP
jgi:hypothetical protein